jgi:rod shape-determining protein MreC
LDFDGSRKARQRDLALAAGVLVLALVIWLLPSKYQTPLQSAIRATLLRPFLSAQATLASRRVRTVDVSGIRAQRDSLLALVSALSPLADENARLRELLALRQRTGNAFVPAEVLRLGVGPAAGTFMINVGSADGVRVESPVIAPEGLLGQVIAVSEHMAQAIDWTNTSFHASVSTIDGAAQGIASVRPGRWPEENLLTLNGASFHTDVHPGTQVVTTGRGGVYPRGIPVGVVLAVDESDTGWRKNYLMRPAVRPELVTHVLVGVNIAAGSDFAEAWHVNMPARDTVRVQGGAGAAGGPASRPARDTTVVDTLTTRGE